MEVTGFFSQGFDILKRNIVIAVPFVVVGIITGLIALVIMGSMVASMGLMGMEGFTTFNPAALGTMIGAGLLLVTLNWLLNTVAAGTTYVMAAEAIGGKPDLGSGVQKTLGNIVNLLATSILFGVIVFIGMILLVIPGLIAAYLLMFSLVIVMLEDKGPIAALQSSLNVVTSNLADTIIFAIIAIVIVIVIGIIAGILGPLSPIINGVGMAYISIVFVLVYKDLTK
jgi:hypothetical protein